MDGLTETAEPRCKEGRMVFDAATPLFPLPSLSFPLTDTFILRVSPFPFQNRKAAAEVAGGHKCDTGLICP